MVGILIKDDVYERVRLVDFIAALMALTNEKISRSAKGARFIARIPRFIIKFMLYVMKGFESL